MAEVTLDASGVGISKNIDFIPERAAGLTSGQKAELDAPCDISTEHHGGKDGSSNKLGQDIARECEEDDAEPPQKADGILCEEDNVSLKGKVVRFAAADEYEQASVPTTTTAVAAPHLHGDKEDNLPTPTSPPTLPSETTKLGRGQDGSCDESEHHDFLEDDLEAIPKSDGIEGKEDIVHFSAEDPYESDEFPEDAEDNLPTHPGAEFVEGRAPGHLPVWMARRMSRISQRILGMNSSMMRIGDAMLSPGEESMSGSEHSRVLQINDERVIVEVFKGSIS